MIKELSEGVEKAIMPKDPFSNNSYPDWESEKKILESAKSGDLDALGRIYDINVNRVYNYSLSKLANIQNAEDVTGEIFIKVVMGLDNYEYRKIPFAAWLMKIARNEVVSFIRRNNKWAHDGQLPDELVDNRNIDPSAIVEQSMMQEDLRTAIAKLPEAQREVIILRFASGLSVSDTAKALGKRENNTKVLQHKGLLRLQVLMSSKYPEILKSNNRNFQYQIPTVNNI